MCWQTDAPDTACCGCAARCSSSRCSSWRRAHRAQSVAGFYRGKQISWILSADAGGGYSSYALAFAPYLTAHLPGNPKIIVQNMPGAGGIRAMLYLNSRAPRDGTTIAMVHSSVPFAPLYGIAEAKFDPRRMNWIGSIDAAASICVVWHTSPVKTWQDALEKSSPSAVPARAPTWKRCRRCSTSCSARR
jgi:tripartite-type tricarboxylate transporter receptor subunit TctC